MQQTLLTVVVPIFNEEDSLPHFLPALVDYCQQQGWSLILVNDGSDDETRSFLNGFEKLPGVIVIHHGINHGYGGALKTGLSKVRSEYAVTIDADGQHNPEDIHAMLALALKEQADLVVGSRPPEFIASTFRSTGKWIIRSFAKFLMKLPVRDLNSGFKLYRTELVQMYLELCPDSMAFSDIITLVFINQRHLVLEQPITINARLAGKSTVNVYTAFDTLINILNIAMMFNPLRVFLPLSFIALFSGFAWGLPIILTGRGVSVGSVLAIFTGLLLFMVGMVANQLSAIRLQLIYLKSRSKD